MKNLATISVAVVVANIGFAVIAQEAQAESSRESSEQNGAQEIQQTAENEGNNSESAAYFGGAKFDTEKVEQSDQGGVTLVGADKKIDERLDETTTLLLAAKDDDIFLNIEDQDIVKWKIVREQMEALNTKFPTFAEMTQEGIMGAKRAIFQKQFTKIIGNYIRMAVFAQEARRQGLTPDQATLDEQRALMRKETEAQGKAGEKMLALLDAPESLYEHNLTNAILWQAYTEQIVKPKITITEEEILARINFQKNRNMAIVATNIAKRAQIDEALARIKSGEIDFEMAASLYSEDMTNEDGGVFLDEDDAPRKILEGEMMPEIENAYMKMEVGEISEIIETPFSWHILKLLKKNPETETESESVELAHILKEKIPVKPEMTHEQARESVENRKMNKILNQEFPVLFQKTKIECMIPLFDEEKPGKKKKQKVRIIRDEF